MWLTYYIRNKNVAYNVKLHVKYFSYFFCLIIVEILNVDVLFFVGPIVFKDKNVAYNVKLHVPSICVAYQ